MGSPLLDKRRGRAKVLGHHVVHQLELAGRVYAVDRVERLDDGQTRFTLYGGLVLTLGRPR